MANRKVSRLLRVFAVCLLPIVTQAQTNNPKHPTWWAKYQYLAANGATKSGAQTSAVIVDKNVFRLPFRRWRQHLVQAGTGCRPLTLPRGPFQSLALG